MKKIILFFAVLALSIGPVWGEYVDVISGSTSNNDRPFNTNTTDAQTFEMIIPKSALSAHVTDGLMNGNVYKAGITGFDYQYFNEIEFYTNNSIQNLAASSCTIKIKSVGNITDITNVTDAESTEFTVCTLSINNTRCKISLPQNSKFLYKTADGGLYIKIEVQFLSDHLVENPNWQWTDNSLYTNACRCGGNTNSGLPKLSLYGSREVSCTVDGSDYLITTFPLTATLVRYGTGTNVSSKYISSYVGDYVENPDPSDVTGGLYSMYSFKEVQLPFTLNGSTSTNKATISKLGSGAFKDVTFSGNCAVIFESSISSIGDENSKNECFDIDANSTGDVLFIFNSDVPNDIYSKGDDYDNFVSPAVKNKVHLRAGVKSAQNAAPFSSWENVGAETSATNLTAKFVDCGWTWHPFSFQTNNIHEDPSVSIGVTAEQTYIKVAQYPFKNISLKVELTGIPEGAHDGSWCYYDQINKAYRNREEITPSGDNKSAECEISANNFTISTELKYHTNIEYGNGLPYFDYSDDKDKVYNKSYEPVLFNGSETLTFKLDTTQNEDGTITFNEDNVPSWKYTNDPNEHDKVTAPESLYYDGIVQVEKFIDSRNYRYFSLPFDCSVSGIEVHKVLTDANGVKTLDSNSMPLFEDEINDKTDWSGYNADHYIIQEYKGQQSDNHGQPKYQTITNSSTELKAGHGYAFAIVQAGENDVVEAVITLKSATRPVPFYLNTADRTIDGIESSDGISDTGDERDERNAGWRMIGNPFYHPLNASNYYGANDQQIKYVTKINKDESVSHHWINEEVTHYEDIHAGSDPSGVTIQPFEAFFVQAPCTLKTVTIHPDGSTPQNLPAAKQDIQEHLSVKVTGQDGSFDRTTVINDESRDEHFKMMDDLAKIMNPGVQIYTWYDSVPCAFKELPMRADSTMAIPLGVRVAEAGNYTFTLDTNLTFFYGAAMLHDKQMSQYHPLNENGVQVSLTEGTDNARFEIVIVPSEIPADVENVETSETLDAYVHDGRLVVENIENGSTLSIYDISGRLLYSAPAAGDFSYRFSAHGVYMVVLQGNTTGSIKVVY